MPANPASARIEGAAIGCRNTRAGNRSGSALRPASAVRLLSSSELIRSLLSLRYLVVRDTSSKTSETSPNSGFQFYLAVRGNIDVGGLASKDEWKADGEVRANNP